MYIESIPDGDVFTEEKRCRLVESVINVFAEQKVSVGTALIILEDARIQIKKNSVVLPAKTEASGWDTWKLDPQTR